MTSEGTSPGMRICIVGPDPNSAAAGGVATHLRVLSRLAIFKKAVFCQVRGRNGPFKGTWTQILADLNRLRTEVRRADVIMLNASISRGSLAKLCLQLLIVPARSSKRVFVFFHGGMFRNEGLGWCVLRSVLASIGRRVSSFCFLTEAQRLSFERILPEFPTSRYRNFSDAHDVLEKAESEEFFQILFVGRVTEDKGVFELLKAYQIVEQKRPGVFKLVIVGDGDALSDLKDAAGIMKFGRIEFPGYLQGLELEDEYRKAGVVVLPSRHPEGFPYVYIEAMRAGVPMLATSVGALSELIRNGENGFIIAAEANDIAEKVLLIADREREGRSLRDACHATFLDTLNAESANSFYRHLLNSI